MAIVDRATLYASYVLSHARMTVPDQVKPELAAAAALGVADARGGHPGLRTLAGVISELDRLGACPAEDTHALDAAEEDAALTRAGAAEVRRQLDIAQSQARSNRELHEAAVADVLELRCDRDDLRLLLANVRDALGAPAGEALTITADRVMRELQSARTIRAGIEADRDVAVRALEAVRAALGARPAEPAEAAARRALVELQQAKEALVQARAKCDEFGAIVQAMNSERDALSRALGVRSGETLVDAAARVRALPLEGATPSSVTAQREDTAGFRRRCSTADALQALGVPFERAHDAARIAEEEGGATPEAAHAAVLRLAGCMGAVGFEQLTDQAVRGAARGPVGRETRPASERFHPGPWFRHVDGDLSEAEKEALRNGGFTETTPGGWLCPRDGAQVLRWIAAGIVAKRTEAEKLARVDETIASMKAREAGLSAEDAETLRGDGWAGQHDGLWFKAHARGCDPMDHGLFDPRSPQGIKALRERAARIRARKPAAAHGEPEEKGEAPSGDHAATGSSSVTEQQGAAQVGAGLAAVNVCRCDAWTLEHGQALGICEVCSMYRPFSAGPAPGSETASPGAPLSKPAAQGARPCEPFYHVGVARPGCMRHLDGDASCSLQAKPSALPKPSRVEVGQRWRSAAMDSDLDVLSLDPTGGVAMSRADGLEALVTARADVMLTSDRWTFLGPAPAPRGPDGAPEKSEADGRMSAADMANALQCDEPAEEPSEPTARDAVAGMLLRHDLPASAAELARGKIGPAELASDLAPENDPNVRACIAALEALDRGDLRPHANTRSLVAAIDRLTKSMGEARAEAAALLAEVTRLRAVKAAHEAEPPLPRIEVRDGVEWLVGADLDEWSDCEAYAPGEPHNHCTRHHLGFHISGGIIESGGAIKIDARWPIDTPPSDDCEAEAPTGMRIEKRADGEYLVGAPSTLSDCGEVSDAGGPCHYHLGGQHIRTSYKVAEDGAEKIIARWPIAPAQESQCGGPKEARAEPGCNECDTPAVRVSVQAADRQHLFDVRPDRRVDLIVPAGLDAREVLATVAELLGITVTPAGDEDRGLVRTATPEELEAEAMRRAIAGQRGSGWLWGCAAGIREGERRAAITLNVTELEDAAYRRGLDFGAHRAKAEATALDAEWQRVTGCASPGAFSGVRSGAHAAGVEGARAAARATAQGLVDRWAHMQNAAVAMERACADNVHGRDVWRERVVILGMCGSDICAAFGLTPGSGPGGGERKEPAADDTRHDADANSIVPGDGNSPLWRSVAPSSSTPAAVDRTALLALADAWERKRDQKRAEADEYRGAQPHHAAVIEADATRLNLCARDIRRLLDAQSGREAFMVDRSGNGNHFQEHDARPKLGGGERDDVKVFVRPDGWFGLRPAAQQKDAPVSSATSDVGVVAEGSPEHVASMRSTITGLRQQFEQRMAEIATLQSKLRKARAALGLEPGEGPIALESDSSGRERAPRRSPLSAKDIARRLVPPPCPDGNGWRTVSAYYGGPLVIHAHERTEELARHAYEDVVSLVTRALEDPRERAQELAERWRSWALGDIQDRIAAVCAFELAEAFGLDPEGAAHEPDPKPCATCDGSGEVSAMDYTGNMETRADCDGRGTPGHSTQDGSSTTQPGAARPEMRAGELTCPCGDVLVKSSWPWPPGGTCLYCCTCLSNFELGTLRELRGPNDPPRGTAEPTAQDGSAVAQADV